MAKDRVREWVWVGFIGKVGSFRPAAGAGLSKVSPVNDARQPEQGKFYYHPFEHSVVQFYGSALGSPSARLCWQEDLY